MKLKIQNLHKIVGKTIPFDTGWIVDDVTESDDLYTFLCEKKDAGPQGWITCVRLKRDGFVEGSYWKYRFFRPGSNGGISQVTPDWFGKMDNALNAIANELDRILNNNKTT